MILSLFVAGAVLCGGFEVWKCDFHGRRSTLCALDVWTKFFVAGAGNREVASCGGGECRCDIGIGVCAGVVWRGWNRKTAWQGCLMCVLRWSLPLDFWRKSHTKCSFWRL